MIRNQTSLAEQSLFYYISKFFSDAINRYRFTGVACEMIEADIYVPQLKTAIEYDGGYWHKNKAEKDIRKNEALNSNGIYVIHIRGEELPKLPPYDGVTLIHGKSGFHTNEFITETIHILASKCLNDTIAQQLGAFCLEYDDYLFDIPDIESAFYDTYQEENATHSCSFAYWNYGSNRRLNPENVPLGKVAAWYTCPNGRAIKAIASDTTSSSSCKAIDMVCTDDCMHEICPFLYCCTEECSKIESYVMDVLYDRKSIRSNGLTKLWEWLSFSDSRIVINAIGELLNNTEDSLFFDRFQALLVKKQSSDNASLIGGKKIQIDCVDDLITLERLHEIHPQIFLWFNASPFDVDDESRKALLTYIEKRLTSIHPALCDTIISHIFSSDLADNNISYAFISMLATMVEQSDKLKSWQKTALLNSIEFHNRRTLQAELHAR